MRFGREETASGGGGGGGIGGGERVAFRLGVEDESAERRVEKEYGSVGSGGLFCGEVRWQPIRDLWMWRGGERREVSWAVYDFEGAKGVDLGNRRRGEISVVNRRTEKVYSAARREYGGTRKESFSCGKY